MLETIQGLRALATLVVAFAHVDQVMNGLEHTRAGESVVVLFFILSGFIMVYKCHGKAVSPLSFIVDRLHRCVPLYWTLTLAVFALALFVPGATQATTPDVSQLTKSLLFIPFVKSNGLVQPVLYVGWTLNYEMIFYAMFSVALMLRNRTAGLALCIATLVAIVVLGLFVPHAWPVVQFLTNSQLLMFAFGMSVALAYVWRDTAAPSMSRVLAEGVLIVSLLGLILVPLWAPRAPEALTCGITAVVALGSALVLEGSKTWLGTRWLGHLGDASYSIYLTHTFVLELFARACARLHLSGIAFAVAEAVCVVGIVVAGLLLRRYLERPLGRLTSRVLWAYRARRTAVV